MPNIKPSYIQGNIQIYYGDNLEIIPVLESNSIDSIITDPPYALQFMGKEWDKVLPAKEIWVECLRVAKPGAMMLVFGGDRTHHRLMVDIEDAGFEIRTCLYWLYGCLSEDTEILTENGFKKYTEIRKGENVANFNLMNDEITYQGIEEIFVYDYDGELYNINGRTTDQLLTPNHKIVLRERRTKGHNTNYFWTDWKLKPAQDLTPYRGLSLPLAGSFNGNWSIGKEMAELVGWVIAEGSYKKKGDGICISQSSDVHKSYINRIRELLEYLNLDYTELKNRKVHKIGELGYTEERISNIVEFHINSESGNKIKAIIPEKKLGRKLLTLVKDDLEALFDGLVMGDGSYKQKSDQTLGDFYQKDKIQRDLFQQLCLHIGYKSSQNDKKESVSWGKKSWMRIDAGWFSRKVKKVQYKGKVWCVQVSTGAFVARRNGKIFITGNSGFPKSLDIGKAIDKINYKPRKVEAFQEYLLKAVKQTYGSHYKLAEEMGIAESLIRHWVGKCGSQDEYPTKAKYAILKQKLNLDDNYDYLIEWAEAQREIIGKDKNWGEEGTVPLTGYKEFDITAPATPEAQLWDGWGSGLKPAVEIIVLAMAPLDGTFAENALKHGVAGLAIDKARISVGPEGLTKGGCTKWGGIFGSGDKCSNPDGHPKGRYPSNLFLSHSPECRQTGVKKVKSESGGDSGIRHQDAFLGAIPAKGELLKGRSYAKDGTETVPAYECVEGCPVKMLDEQAGPLKSGAKHGIYNGWGHKREIYGDTKPYLQHCEASSGGPSRFFYCAKSSRSEREQGLKGHIPCVKCGGLDTDFHLDDKGDKVKCVRNDHPTVKPQAILNYLCKLTMTPTGGVVLDMFGGTGTTALACENIDRKCILIEKEKKSCDIAVARLKGLTKQGRLWDV